MAVTRGVRHEQVAVGQLLDRFRPADEVTQPRKRCRSIVIVTCNAHTDAVTSPLETRSITLFSHAHTT